ncbi:MAG: hypothetical protein U1E73_04500 [Planctomycetota bacterium]
MNKSAKVSIVGVLLAVLAAIFGPEWLGQHGGTGAPNAPAVPSSTPAAPAAAPIATPPSAAPAKAPAPAPAPAPKAAQKPAPKVAAPAVDTKVGFTSKSSFESHFEKHGAEFGSITAAQYLLRAQTLRDAALSKTILEAVRDDGVITRFDKDAGDFIAFHKDKTIRTFFRPNDGEAYFKRQAQR